MQCKSVLTAMSHGPSILSLLKRAWSARPRLDLRRCLSSGGLCYFCFSSTSICYNLQCHPDPKSRKQIGSGSFGGSWKRTDVEAAP